jgi:hypothetical protein
LIEKYFVEKVDDPDIDIGAYSSYNILDMDRFTNRYYSSESKNNMRIIKLHGSINWIKDPSGKLIAKDLGETVDSLENKNENGYIQGEVIIYPISQKLLYLSPFIQFFNFFEKELRNNKIWIVIGYSFRDIIIRNMFERSIETIKNILLITPHSDSVKNLFNDKTQKKITEIKYHFGNNSNYNEVNKKIAENYKKYAQG